MQIGTLEEFAALYRPGPEAVPILDAAISVERSFNPDVDESRIRRELAELGRAAPPRDPVPGVFDAATQLCRFLHDEQGFTGNYEHYYEPDNSYISAVLRRRCGIPISLSVVYQETAATAGLRAYGINFPRTYLVGLEAAGERALIDPFEGRVLSEDECRERLEQTEPDAAGQLESHLAPAGTVSFTVRMLSNLKSIFLQDSHYEAALACCERILLLSPDSARDIYDLAVAYENLGSPDAAIVELRRLRNLVADDAVRRALDNKIRTVDEGRRPTLH